MTDPGRVPIGDVLPGFTLDSLDSQWTPLQAFILIKALDDQGDPVWAFRTSEQFNLEELLGALTVQTEALKRKLTRLWEDDDPDYIDDD